MVFWGGGGTKKVSRWIKKFVFPQQKEENWRDHNSTEEIIIRKIIPP